MKKIIIFVFASVVLICGQNFKTNKHFIDSLKHSIESEPSLQQKSRMYNNIAAEFIKTYQYDSINYYSRKALDISKKNGFKDEEGTAYKNLAISARIQFNKRDYYIYIRYAIDMFEETHNIKELSNCYGYLGSLYVRYKPIDTAQVYYDMALKYANLSGDSILIGKTYSFLGQYYNLKGDQKQSDSYFRKGKEIFINAKDSVDLVILLGRYAYTRDTLGYKDESLAMLQKSLDIVSTGENIYFIGDVMVDYGLFLLRNKYFDKAKLLLENALKYTLKCKSGRLTSLVYSYLSNLYMQRKEYKKAADCLFLSYKYINENFDTLDAASVKMQEHLTDLEKTSTSMMMKQKDIEFKNMLLMAAATIIVFVLVFVLYTFRQKTRSNRELRIKNETIFKQNKELEEFNKELESFSYSVSHDLKAPLRGISGFCTILSEDYSDKLDSQGKEYISRIFNASTKMSQLIDSMLNLSRISRYDLKKSETNLSKAVTEICTFLKEINKDRNIIFNIQENVHAECDPKLISIALENLLNNAVKFTSLKEQAIIEFGTSKKETGDIFFIKDNGAGFDNRYYNKLFNVFQRLHGQDEFPGSGVGLAIVKRIITKHGGTIWAESKLNEGSVFYFTL